MNKTDIKRQIFNNKHRLDDNRVRFPWKKQNYQLVAMIKMNKRNINESEWGWCSTSPQQHGRVGVNRSRRQSLQQRHFRRNYGVSSTNGDGQTLLPNSANNQTNSLHRHNTNMSSSSETSHRVNPTSTTTNNHHRSYVAPQTPQGMPKRKYVTPQTNKKKKKKYTYLHTIGI